MISLRVSPWRFLSRPTSIVGCIALTALALTQLPSHCGMRRPAPARSAHDQHILNAAIAVSAPEFCERADDADECRDAYQAITDANTSK